MIKNAEFERCIDFLARMIEKYGNEIALPNTADMNKKIYENNEKIAPISKISS